jgi:hypothetical protein
MSKRYVYKNVNERPVNIGGYQFSEGQALESDILISGFNEAVSNGFLELTERKPDSAEPDATQAPQTSNTGKVTVIFHMGVDSEGKEVIEEAILGPDAPVEFPNVDLRDDETFEGWFKDAEFTKPVNVEKVKAPKEGDLHFYGKFGVAEKKEKTENLNSAEPLNPNAPQNPNAGTDSPQDQIPPVPPSGNELPPEGSENK